MRKVLITFGGKRQKSEEIFNNLNEKLQLSGIEATPAYGYESLEMQMLEGGTTPIVKVDGTDIADFDAVIIYTGKLVNIDVTSLIGHYCRLKQIPLVNSRYATYYESGKILQKLLLPFAGLSVPYFYFSANPEGLTYQQVKEKLGDTFVVKFSRATHGDGVQQISSQGEFTELLKLYEVSDKFDSGTMYFEEFIPHSATARGVVTGDRCRVRIDVQTEADSFKTNRGKAIFTQNVDREFAVLCESAAKEVKLEIAGVDVVYDQRAQKYKVLEVNKSPGITLEPVESPEATEIAQLITRLVEKRSSWIQRLFGN